MSLLPEALVFLRPRHPATLMTKACALASSRPKAAANSYLMDRHRENWRGRLTTHYAPHGLGRCR
jgi:hypothetical protein